MKKTVHFLLTIQIALAISISSYAQQSEIMINTEKAEHTINKNIYGHFSEHLGTLIYGGIWVGEDSDIPNTEGYRTDVLEALKELKVPVLRWPGGCFADTYHWKDGIGPKEERPSIVNVFWGGVTEDNSFGTHEFLNFCELIGTEPYLSINVGTGTVQEAVDWVEYVTSSNESPMTDLRKKNGREDPWDVKFWGIGNETWGCGGEMRPEYYADIYRHFAGYIRGSDFQRVAVGPSSGDYNWTEKLMAGLEGKMHLTQGISLHHYTLPTNSWSGSKGSSINFEEDMWFNTFKHTLVVEEFIQKHLEIMDKYDPEGKVPLIVDEWGTWYDALPGTNPGFLQQQNSLRDALVAGVNLNIFNNHAERVSMANIAQIVNVLQAMILTDGPEMVKTPTYYAFKMYNVHQDALLLPTQINTPYYTYNDESLPAVNVSASQEENGNVNVTLTNIDPDNAVSTTIRTDKNDEFEVVNAEFITADKIDAYNKFGEEEEVNIQAFDGFKVKKETLTVDLPSKSVVLLTLKKK